MAEMTRIQLSDKLQRKWFVAAMKVLERNKHSLSDYNWKFYDDMAEAFALLGDEMTLTVKQMNHLRQLALELESGR